MKNKLKLVLNELKNINYGFVDNDCNIYPDNFENWDSNFSKLYHLQSPEQLLETKYGVCWDQVELERFLLEKRGISSFSYFIIAHDKKQEPTHTFLVIKDDKYYWFEHSWEPYRGIHDYNTLNELLLDVKLKFEESIKRNKINNYEIAIYHYDKPSYNLNCIEFMNYCESGRRVDL